MDYLKQTDSYEPFYAVKLENGVILLVFGDYALGSDGKTYYSITKVDTVFDEEYGFDDEEYSILGWSSEIDEPRIIEE